MLWVDVEFIGVLVVVAVVVVTSGLIFSVVVVVVLFEIIEVVEVVEVVDASSIVDELWSRWSKSIDLFGKTANEWTADIESIFKTHVAIKTWNSFSIK